MAKSTKVLILEALDDLGEESLKKFKRKLNEEPPEAGYNRIPRGKLEKADRIEIANLIFSYYLQDYGLRITLQVLGVINERAVAESLRRNAAAADFSDAPSEATTATGNASRTLKYRFEMVQPAPLPPTL